ncbi:glycosyltransferase [Crateriforma spongiae]|uniref:glycosyltransferase n=1 Tax=Crateriforma spongiae TaxID=2724528 RepID=UPI0039AEEC94
MVQANRQAALLRGTRWDATQAGPRAIECLEELGYSVTVFCWDQKGDKPRIEIVGKTEIHWYRRPVPAGSFRKFLAWPFLWFWIFRQLVSRKFDIVYSMNLDPTVGAVLAKPFRRHKIAYDIRDPWGLCLTEKPFPIEMCVTILDRFTSRFVDGIILSQGIVDRCAEYFGKFVTKRKAVTQVLNVPQNDLLAESQKGGISHLPSKINLQDFRINFSGLISSLRGAYTLIELSEYCRLHIDVVGEIRNPELAEAFSNAERCTVYGRVPYGDAMKLMRNSTLVSLLYDPSLEIVFIASANKMFESMMLGKPYVCTRGSFPAIIAERFDLGWSVDYGDIDQLRRVIEEASDPQRYSRKCEHARNAYEKYFRWESQKSNLMTMIRSIEDDLAIDSYSWQGWSNYIGIGNPVLR